MAAMSLPAPARSSKVPVDRQAICRGIQLETFLLLDQRPDAALKSCHLGLGSGGSRRPPDGGAGRQRNAAIRRSARRITTSRGQYLEQAGRAHAAANAHGDHAQPGTAPRPSIKR